MWISFLYVIMVSYTQAHKNGDHTALQWHWDFLVIIFPTHEKGASRDGGAHSTLAACMEKVNRWMNYPDILEDLS